MPVMTIRQRAAAEVAQLWEARLVAMAERNLVYAAWVSETPGLTSREHLNPAEEAFQAACRRHGEADARLQQLRRLDAHAARAVARQGVR